MGSEFLFSTISAEHSRGERSDKIASRWIQKKSRNPLTWINFEVHLLYQYSVNQFTEVLAISEDLVDCLILLFTPTVFGVIKGRHNGCKRDDSAASCISGSAYTDPCTPRNYSTHSRSEDTNPAISCPHCRHCVLFLNVSFF